jgi:hypothetical protein
MRGHAQPGVGKIRHAVERCPNFFAQFGRVFRRFDRSARRYEVKKSSIEDDEKGEN